MADYKTLSDDELIQLLKDSDHLAYTEIYNRYFSLLYIHACKKLQDEDQAKDIVQEVFTTLWFKHNLDLQVKDLAAYLFTAVRNKIFDLFAHEKVKSKYLESLNNFYQTNYPVPTDHKIREQQLQEYIDRQIAQLPRKMRTIFELSRKEQLTYQEIAKQLDISENNVSKQVNNALRLIKTKLGSLTALLFFLKI